MRVPVALSNAFTDNFQAILAQFLIEQGLLPDAESLQSKRFLTRSVVPHIQTLSNLFNRRDGVQTDQIDDETYFSDGGSPQNRRLAYFLSFMPCNLFRVASVWAELSRLGFRWPFPDRDLRAIEYGAGSASGACGIIAGEKFAPVGLPTTGNFALVEQSKSMLDLGAKWFDTYAALDTAFVSRSFHRKIDLSSTWLPPSAPKFQLMVMSFFLNESGVSADVLARHFANHCEKHLEDEGLVIIVEPAMKLQSRRLLEFRRELLALNLSTSEKNPLQILLPCLGHQKCGALSIPEDWCHEEVSWWRPPYLRGLDAMVNLDRKTLPFSYLVIQKTKRARHEVLPKISADTAKQHRLVSPTHTLGRDMDFHMCGQEGKRKARMRAPSGEFALERGDIIADVDYRGEPQLTQIDRGRVIEY